MKTKKEISLNINKHDIITFIIYFLCVMSLLIILLINNNAPKNGKVSVRYNGIEIHTMHLNKDEEFNMSKNDYPLLLGDMTIIVENGKVKVDKQTSKYNYCELMGEQSATGTSIVCAPNAVVIVIEGASESDIDWGEVN